MTNNDQQWTGDDERYYREQDEDEWAGFEEWLDEVQATYPWPVPDEDEG